MTDLVVISLEGWDAVWRRNQHLVAGLLAEDRDLRVLFVEPPDDPLHDLRGRRRPRFGHAVRAVDERLWTYRPVKWLPRRLDPHGDERRADRVRRVAARLGFAAPLLWVNDPSAAPLLVRSGWPALYDITDDWLSADRADAELTRVADGERMLLTRAAQVVACSPELVRRKAPVRAESGRPGIRLIPNAVDVTAYREPAPRPAGLGDGPVALYVGTLHTDRLDVRLCADAARALAGRVRLVLAGPDALGPAERRMLDEAGVRRLGPLARADVPAHLRHADVLVVPHVVTPFTESLDPIKLYEYQAANRPVVSTPVAGFRDADDPRVRIADGAGFADAVLDAVAAPLPDRAPAPPDWGERVVEMREVLAALQQTH
ncbi:glycosyltransferase [Microbacterium sp.]|uniref:glycosyltransferase n=1 Tax=Microbacterium sp. TaxID=51671 RepID=UPI0028125D20|nr:glycosyltransferase [Microbacterium sp.]